MTRIAIMTAGGGPMFLPVRFVAESLRATVNYNQTTKTITMTYLGNH